MYKRTLIRNFLVNYLKNDTENITPTFGNKIYGGRVKPLIGEQEKYPFISIFTRNEEITEHLTTHTRRELDINIGVIAFSNTADDLDSVVEKSIYQVEKSMSKLIGADAIAPDPFRLIDEIYLENILIDSDTESKNTIGKAMLNYKVIYDYQRPVGFDISSLVDFDEVGSIANLIITNDGVPGNV
jgi:hypothetical protein